MNSRIEWADTVFPSELVVGHNLTQNSGDIWSEKGGIWVCGCGRGENLLIVVVTIGAQNAMALAYYEEMGFEACRVGEAWVGKRFRVGGMAPGNGRTTGG